MALQSNLNEISTSWTKKKVTFIGITVLVATSVCISVIFAVSVKSSSPEVPLALSLFKEKMNLTRDEIKWVSYSSDNYSLTDALAGGTGSDGKTVYVCRAKRITNNGEEVIPGTFDPNDTFNFCTVTRDKRALSFLSFELLVIKDPSRLVWKAESHGRIKNGAISGGYTASNKILYVTRFKYDGFFVSGKLDQLDKEASGLAGNDQIKSVNYDVLCVDDYAL
uniref:Uncharacterized protein n=1 Tax=Tetranychus urticae TaxID=32264 RepID=T1KCU2_TETUR